jgi:two-component system, OmpR family, alkaline phosphatase synthesis response regulator PhoP
VLGRRRRSVDDALLSRVITGWMMIQNVATQPQPGESATDRRHQILIVDDDRPQVEALSLRLERQGFSTVLAHEGRSGLSLARQRRPDLVLLDLGLPDVHGLEVCEQLVDSPETCGIPIIIVSGLDEPDVVRSARSAGCEYFLRKPYDPNALLTLIQHALRRDCFDW